MYYYCNRSEVSARAGGPGMESCGAGCPRLCCGGGGCTQPLSGDGSSAAAAPMPRSDRERESRLAEAQTFREWRDTDPARDTDQGFFTHGGADITREGDGCAHSREYERGRCCRQSAGADGDGTASVDRGLRCVVGARAGRDERRAAARLTRRGAAIVTAALRCGPGEPALVKRRGCALSRATKRVCFAGTYCGTSGADFNGHGTPDAAGPHRVRFAASPPHEDAGLPTCRAAKGRVRLYRVRSLLAGSNGLSGSGQSSSLRGRPQPQQRGEEPSPEQLEAVRSGAERRQMELEGRSEQLWRRLQAVQVKQVERHVTQQLSGLSSGVSGTRSSLELGRLAHSCGEILRTAESALDSDHTASSSGGDSDSEDEDDEDDDDRQEKGWRRLRPLAAKSIVTGREWRWMASRAWLGSRWVWLQTQVSELEYRIRALTELHTSLRQGKVRSPHVPDRSSDPKLPPAGDPTRKWQKEDTPTERSVPSPPSAARVRPLLWERRHRLIRLRGCAALGSKQALSLQCWCEPPSVCVLCGDGGALKQKGQWMPQAWLDMSVHPVLSMPSDAPLALHCGIGPLVGHHSHGSLQSTHLLGRRGRGQAGKVRRRLVCPRPPNALPPLFNTPCGSGCRSQRNVIFPVNCLPTRTTESPTFPPTPPASDAPAQPLRRRRTESSFDIDNLVMPSGLAGLGARVQKIQYKEIITPSWRELDSLLGSSRSPEEPMPPSPSYCPTQHQPAEEAPETELEEEELSDAVFLRRHALCESRERSRWGSRARRRRRGRSSSCFHGDGKSFRGQEHTPDSPDSRQGHCAEGDVSPHSPFCTGAEDPFSRAEDEQQAVLPWERRSFPLKEAELQWLQEEEEEEEAEPEEDPCTANGRSQSTDSGISVGSLELSPRTEHTRSSHPLSQRTVSTAQDSHTFSTPDVRSAGPV